MIIFLIFLIFLFSVFLNFNVLNFSEEFMLFLILGFFFTMILELFSRLFSIYFFKKKERLYFTFSYLLSVNAALMEKLIDSLTIFPLSVSFELIDFLKKMTPSHNISFFWFINNIKHKMVILCLNNQRLLLAGNCFIDSENIYSFCIVYNKLLLNLLLRVNKK